MRRLVVALVFVAACGHGPQEAPSSGEAVNVTGTLDRGPIATCPADEPCDPPALASALTFSPATGPPVTVRVGPDGAFALRLAPGDYAIAAAPPAFGGTVVPSSVKVPAGGSVVLRLKIVRSP